MALPRVRDVWQRRQDWGMFCEALVWIGCAAIAIRLCSFEWICSRLSAKASHPQQSTDDLATLRRIRWAVRSASRHVPWRSVCFHETIAAQRMLIARGFPAIAHYGIGYNPADSVRELSAHTWVSVKDWVVVGDETRTHFTEITRFPSQ